MVWKGFPVRIFIIDTYIINHEKKMRRINSGLHTTFIILKGKSTLTISSNPTQHTTFFIYKYFVCFKTMYAMRFVFLRSFVCAMNICIEFFFSMEIIQISIYMWMDGWWCWSEDQKDRKTFKWFYLPTHHISKLWIFLTILSFKMPFD